MTTMTTFFAAAVLCLAHGQVAPVVNADEAGAAVGVRPYEMDRAGRDAPKYPQLADFENLDGWQVRAEEGARAEVFRSQEEMLFGDYVAKAVYSGENRKSCFVIEAPRPIPIPGRPTGVNLWVRGNNWGWVNPPATARTWVKVLVRDGHGDAYAIDLGQVNFDYWFLMHRTFVSPQGDFQHCAARGGTSDTPVYPLSFVGIEVSGCSNGDAAKLFFDALSFYTIEYPWLEFEPPPASLPWPTTPDTIRPTAAPGLKATMGIKETGLELVASMPDAPALLTYKYAPKTGTLDDLTVEASGAVFQPCAGGHVEFEIGGRRVRPGDPGVAVESKGCAVMPEGGASYPWRLTCPEGTADFVFGFRLVGRSLIIDVSTKSTEAYRFHAGHCVGLPGADSVYFPYMTYGNDWPRVVCAPEPRLFVSALLDWYNTDASSWFGAPALAAGDGVAYIGGATYAPITTGKRNPMRERLFVTVSDEVHEVLPNIPNPKCDTGKVAREYVWRNIGEPKREMLTRYKAYGIDKFIACHHEVGWRDAGESFTMRLEAAPRIGDEGLADYSAWLRGLGYRFGTYTNYVDFAPVNSNWNEDYVALNPDGTWKRAWPRNYSLKPVRAVEMEAYYAPKIHEKFGTNAQYCDVHTALAPWGRTDHDARAPDAGMFRSQFEAYARLLWNESGAHHGPVFSEGNHHWFYAGIVDGNYATILPQGRGYRVPPLVDFDLLKMHPLMTDFGMGMPQMFYGREGEWRKDKSRLSPWFDRFHASTIAFGHIGFLAEDWGFDGTLKSYYLLQALQQRYAMVPVSRIRYFDGEELLDTSEAIVSGAYKRGQVVVRYRSGLETFCNLGWDEDWAIPVRDNDCILPPGGFFARKKNDILAYSAVVRGQRHELVSCADYLYLDSRGEFVDADVIAARGTVAVKPDGDAQRAGGGPPRSWWVIPATVCGPVGVSVDWLGGQGTFEATAHTEDGTLLGPAEVRIGFGRCTVMPVADAAKYLLTRLLSEAEAYDFTIPLPLNRLVPAKEQLRRVELRWAAPAEAPAVLRVSAHAGDWETIQPLRPFGGPSQAMAMVPFALPKDAAMGERCWYRVHLESRTGETLHAAWLAVDAVPAFSLSLSVVSDLVIAGESMALSGRITGNDPACGQAQVRLDASSGVVVAPRQHRLRFAYAEPRAAYVAGPARARGRLRPYETTPPRGQGQAEAMWTLPSPAPTEVVELAFVLHGRGLLARKTYYLSSKPVEPVLLRLRDLPMETACAVRGLPEQALASETGAEARFSVEQVGGHRQHALYVHPPWKTGVGYTVASFDVALPESVPVLEFSLGFREGSSTQDGCLFRVVAIRDGIEETVFEEQYATTDAWKPCRVPLGGYPGCSIVLKLITDVGPADNSTSDWACWGEPRITLDAQLLRVQVRETPPKAAFAPPPGDASNEVWGLAAAVSGELVLESAGVNAESHACDALLNGIALGPVPSSGSDTEWQPGTLALNDAALRALDKRNRLSIRNPKKDFMKLRNVYLRLRRADGAEMTTWVARGPYCSARGWPHAEGECVAVGEDLPAIYLDVPAGVNP